MGRIRDARRNSITQVLENSDFTAWDFSIDYPDGGEDLVVIHFLHERSFSFVIKEVEYEDSYRAAPYSVFRSPGYDTVEDHLYCEGWKNCIVKLRDWCLYINEELVTRVPNVVLDNIESLRVEITEKIEQYKDELQGYFNSEEIDKIKSILDS